MRLYSKYFLLVCGLFAGVIACDDDDNGFSVTPAIGFGGTVLQVSETIGDEGGVAVPFYANVKLTEPVTITMAVRDDASTTYGTDYTTIPAPVDGVITLTIQPDETPVFMVYPVKYDASPDVRKVNFEITSLNGGNVPLTDTYARYYELWITKEARIIDHDFEDCSGTAIVFKEVSSTGGDATKSVWACTTFGYSPISGKYTIGVEANAFGKGGASPTNSYLISERIDVPEDFNSIEVGMKVWSQFSGNGTLAVLYSENYSGTGDPEATGVTWLPLPNKVKDATKDPATVTQALPAPASKAWSSLTGVLTNTANKHYYVAFQYKGGTTTSASNWRLDEFVVVGIK